MKGGVTGYRVGLARRQEMGRRNRERRWDEEKKNGAQ